MKYLNKLLYRLILFKLRTMEFRGLRSMTNINLHYGTLLPSYHEIPVIYLIQKVQNLKIMVIQSYRTHIPFCCKAEDNEVKKSLHMTDYKASYVCLNY
jgi:hypothetical protein